MPMTYDTIVSITPTGEPPYASAYGVLHSFIVTFASGVSGKVNAKSPSGPPYKPGQTVWYEIQGQTATGANRIKVDAKTPPPQAPAVAQPPPAAVPQPLAKAVQPMNELAVLLGEERGNLLTNAVQIAIHNAKAVGEPLVTENLPTELWDIAEAIKLAGKGLEKGLRPEGDIPF